jgi:hypothetical protein
MGNEGGQGKARGDGGDGDVDNACARPGENFVLAAENARGMPKLSKMCFRQVGRDAGEAASSDGVAGRPAVDQGTPVVSRAS